jgi:hypothetical protein
MDLGTHGGVCGLVMEGRHPGDLGMKVIDRSAPHGICGAQHMDPVTQVDGPVMMEVLLRSVLAASGQGRQSTVESGGGSGTWSVLAAQNPSK